MSSQEVMKVSVREFAEADRAPLRQLFLQARNATFSSAASTHHADDFDLATDGEKILVAHAEEGPVGFASIWLETSFLHNLFVDPQFHRQGIGKTLLASCTPYFTNVPTLKCVKSNEQAQAFYLSQGWQISSEGIGPDGPYFLMHKPAK